MSFSSLIREVRQNLNISQEQLARDIDVSFSTINRWENGRTIPSKLASRRFIEYCKQHGINQETINKLLELRNGGPITHMRGK